MHYFDTPAFEPAVCALLICLLLREAMILFLPDHLTGPGGRLIDTGPE